MKIINEYYARINKTLDFIQDNLDQTITLDDLSSVANFSKYHFNRIFQSIVGETPYQFILRLRLEKAASMLLNYPNEPIGSIAFQCGFAEQAVFSRQFKRYFGISATAFKQRKNKNSTIDQKQSNKDQSDSDSGFYFCHELQTLKWRSTMELNKSIEVQPLPAMTLAYVRHIGPYKGDANLFEKLWNKLFAWAGPRGLIGGPDFRSLVIYHDDPGVTQEEKLRMSVCITVPPETKTEGAIGKMELEAATYVVARFEVDATQFQQAWEWLYGKWFPESGYEPDNKPCFEMYPEEPKDGKFVVDICVPVRPM